MRKISDTERSKPDFQKEFDSEIHREFSEKKSVLQNEVSQIFRKNLIQKFTSNFQKIFKGQCYNECSDSHI